MHASIIFTSLICNYSFFFTFGTTNKTDRHDITEILLKVSLNTIDQLDQRQTTFGTKHKQV